MNNFEFTELELDIIEKVKQDRAEYNKLVTTNPWGLGEDSWYNRFNKLNEDSMKIGEAPYNVPLMVVGGRLSPIYRNDRGEGLNQGSVILKLSDTEIEVLDGEDWYAGSSGASIYGVNRNVYEYGDNIYGRVKILEEIIAG